MPSTVLGVKTMMAGRFHSNFLGTHGLLEKCKVNSTWFEHVLGWVRLEETAISDEGFREGSPESMAFGPV